MAHGELVLDEVAEHAVPTAKSPFHDNVPLPTLTTSDPV